MPETAATIAVRARPFAGNAALIACRRARNLAVSIQRKVPESAGAAAHFQSRLAGKSAELALAQATLNAGIAARIRSTRVSKSAAFSPPG